MKKILDKYSHLFNIMSSKRFLEMEGLNNEVPFFIAPYLATDENEMLKSQTMLITNLAKSNVKVLDINLYEMAIEILEKEDDLEWYLDEETKMSKDEFKEELQSLLDVENILIPAINEKMQKTEFDIMFISGVGAVYPYIRSHNILNNLQKIAKDKPTVMFFPGEYTESLESGSSLDLFGKLRDDKYYRAFNLDYYEI